MISGVTVVTTLVCFLLCTRGCGRIVRPAFPAPSEFQKAGLFNQTSRETRGEIAKLCRQMRPFEIQVYEKFVARAHHHGASSLRKQGPITTDASCYKAVWPQCSIAPPRRMGPCFRRDDERETHSRIPAARARVLLYVLPAGQRAQGMPGARCARSLACKVKSTRA